MVCLMPENVLLRLKTAVLPAVRAATASRFERVGAFLALMRLDRPVGIYLLLWPTLWALWIAADGLPSLHLLVVFAGGVLLMRSAGCVINDFIDRDLDPQVARTRCRPLASGRVAPGEALLLAAVLCGLAFLLVLTTNPLTLALAVPALVGTVIYPCLKRFIQFPQLALGVVFSFGIPMAFAATLNRIPDVAWLLFAANLVWIVAYDTFYAMADREDDLKVGIKSTAILFGRLDRLLTAFLQGLFLALMFALGASVGLGVIYQFSLVLAAGFCLYQQYLIRRREAAACLAAFSNNSRLGAVILVGILLDIQLDIQLNIPLNNAVSGGGVMP